jgi:pimeloyl-ACP methyl ester carboxylesterase
MRMRIGLVRGVPPALPAAVAVVATALASLVASPPTAALAGQRGSAVNWQPCPVYSDDVIRGQGVPDERIPQYRALLNRLECGTVSVPLDYRQPRGRQITVAITRLGAVDQAHRLGSIALNPGGPGGSGYLMPIDVTMFNEESARLNDRYDLIGFDPRGVGYSTKVNCPGVGMGEPPPPGPLTEEAAKRSYDSQVAGNDACGRSDPDFLGQLTTLNVARDLDRMRIALGERKLNFLGVSWGTWLGAVYRSTFPASVGRMFLDSVALPRFSLEAFEDGHAAAAERNFSRMAAWIALHNDTYGFGSTPQQVQAAILALRRSYDANPKQFTDLPMVIDGGLIANLASQSSPNWPIASQALKELRDATGPTAPPTIKEILGGGPTQQTPDAPEQFNPTMQLAAFCNEDPNRPDFSAAWAVYQRRVEQNPVTGRNSRFSAGCAGWPLPGQEIQLHHTGGSLVLSGHRYEIVSLYEWTTQMYSIIGGTVFTVNDDVHGSVLRVPACAAKLVSYFSTGRIDRGCDGVAVPASADGSTVAALRLAAGSRS